jgi:hypothetical protein
MPAFCFDLTEMEELANYATERARDVKISQDCTSPSDISEF